MIPTRERQLPRHLTQHSEQSRKRLAILPIHHSEFDHSKQAQKEKVAGREPLRMHPDAARARGIIEDSTVRVFNARGACLGGVAFSEQLHPDVVELPTGAWIDPWFDPDNQPLERAGNPNVLTRDRHPKAVAGAKRTRLFGEVALYDGAAPAPRTYQATQLSRA